MPNTYIKPEKRVALALAALHQRSKLRGLVTPFDGRNFIGARNDTLFYETQGITVARDYQFRTRTEPIQWDEIYKTRLPITLNQHMTQGVKFTDEEELLDLASYTEEILVPQMNAVADRFDKKISQKFDSYTNFKTDDFELDVTADTDGKNALRSGMKLKRQADKDGVPDQGRILVAGADAFAYFASADATVAYDAGQAKTAFQTATFGKIAGFDVFDGTDLVSDDEFFLIHPSWMVLANAAPIVPQGAAWGARQTRDGWSLRVIRDYDPNYAQDRSLVNTFYGFSPIEDELQHYTDDATAAANNSEVGDVVIEDGEPQYTGKNVRGIHGTITGFSL